MNVNNGERQESHAEDRRQCQMCICVRLVCFVQIVVRCVAAFPVFIFWCLRVGSDLRTDDGKLAETPIVSSDYFDNLQQSIFCSPRHGVRIHVIPVLSSIGALNSTPGGYQCCAA